MQIELREGWCEILGPAQGACLSPGEQIKAQAIALMHGKLHEIAIVAGWRGDQLCAPCVYTDLKRTCVDVPIAETVARLREGATQRAIALHNHCGGPGWPSRADVTATVQLRMALREAGIVLEDSLIVTPTGVVSLQRLNDDGRYRALIEAQFRAALDARFARLDEERRRRDEIARARRQVQRAVERLEAVARAWNAR